MRKTHSKDFKFKVALEAIRGDITIAQIVQSTRWQTHSCTGGKSSFEGAEIFERAQGPKVMSHDVEKLHAKIGKLT